MEPSRGFRRISADGSINDDNIESVLCADFYLPMESGMIRKYGLIGDIRNLEVHLGKNSAQSDAP